MLTEISNLSHLPLWHKIIFIHGTQKTKVPNYIKAIFHTWRLQQHMLFDVTYVKMMKTNVDEYYNELKIE